jgi:hypothetical protein
MEAEYRMRSFLGDCHLSAAKTDFQALYAILNAEIQNLPRSAGSDRMDEIKKTWTPSEDHNLIIDILLCPNPADVVQMNRRTIFRQAIGGEATGVSDKAELLGGIIMPKEIFWDRLGDGHISFAVQFQTPDLLNFVWTTLSATQPRIRDLLMAKIDQLITSGAEPKQWLEMFSRSPHLISMLVILHQSGTSTLNQIDYLDDPRILPSLDLRDFEVMWQVGQLSSFAFIQYFALRPFRRRSYKPSFNSTAEPSHCPGCFRTEAGLWRCSSSTIGN